MQNEFDAEVARVAKGKRRKPPGGKALQRLFAFLGERDPALNNKVIQALGVPKAVWPLFEVGATPKSKQPAGAVKTASAVRRRGVVSRAKAYGAAIAKAALALSAPAAAAPQASGPSWQFIGPSLIPNGQTFGSNRVDVIGRVSCIAVDPHDPTHILVGAAGGGIWESSDTGATYSPRTDQMPSLSIGAIAFDPKTPGTVYAGSGEGNSGYALLGAGVYKSTNGGRNWAVLAAAPFVGLGFFKLVVDPGDPKILYAATIDFDGERSGLYRSKNGGPWSLKRQGICWDISVHPRGGAVELLATFSDGLFVSTSNGDRFVPVALPSAPKGPWKRLAVDRVATSPDIVYAFGAVDKVPYLWRRTGCEWTRITPLPPVDQDRAWTNQAEYDWYVAATPDDQNQVYLGAIDLLRGDFIRSAWKWTNISTQDADSIHLDQHCLAFSPDNSKIIYVGNDGGIFRSANSGTNWAALNAGLGITEIEYLAVDPATSSWLMAGTQDNGTNLFTGTTVWELTADGDGGECAVNPLDPAEAYHSFYWDRDTGLLGFQSSIDQGKTWNYLVPPEMSAIFYPPVQAYGGTVAIGASELIVSRNKGMDWKPVALGLSPDDVSTCLCMTDADTVFVGTKLGSVVVATWAGEAWSRQTLASPTNRRISSIIADPTDPRKLWVTISEWKRGNPSVYRSDKGGASWQSCAAGLPAIPVNAVAVDPTDGNRAWVAADVGVYETRDAGKSWTSFSRGLPNAMAADLHFHAKDRKLICGTRSRGAWVIAVK
jgi:photosystem II stability/assembly factor-like uncharacterized protein